MTDCRGLGAGEGGEDVVKNGGHKGSLSCGTVWCPEPSGGSRNLHLIKLHRTRAHPRTMWV